jgi:hypothetical protein
MKTLKIALGSFLVGAALSIAPIVTYACDAEIWVADTGDCHVYHRYVLVGTGGDEEVQICAYESAGGSPHIESGPCSEMPPVM